MQGMVRWTIPLISARKKTKVLHLIHSSHFAPLKYGLPEIIHVPQNRLANLPLAEIAAIDVELPQAISLVILHRHRFSTNGPTRDLEVHRYAG
jgi:hypothetical protein